MHPASAAHRSKIHRMSHPASEIACPVPILRDVDLQGHNTLRLPARGAAYIDLTRKTHLPDLSAQAIWQCPRLVLGGGSNLVMTRDWPGLVLHMRTRGITCVRENDEARWIEAEAGEPWADFVAYCVAMGWHGLENLAAIPGSVGAAPVQNIGAYGMELADRLDAVQVFDSRHATFNWWPASACGLGYRDSIFKRTPADRYLITAVRFRLPRHPPLRVDYSGVEDQLTAQGIERPDHKALFEAIVAIRQRKLPDPALLPNVGSFFKNPVVDAQTFERLHAANTGLVSFSLANGRHKLAAAWLIEACGWKGRRIGPVGVHDRQALVLIHFGEGNASDLLALAQAIQRDVQAQFGVLLEIEPGVI